jgi:hypothetical protein
MPAGPPTVGPPWSGPPTAAPWTTGPPTASPQATGPWAVGPSAPAWGGYPGLAPPARPVDPGRRGWQVALGVLALVAVIGAAVFALRDTGSTGVADGWQEPASTQPEPSDPTQPPPTTGTTTTAPPTTTTAPPTRLLPAPAPPTEPGPYEFLGFEDDGDPITWDPCETIQYVVNGRRAPPGAGEMLAEALAKVTEATGLVFEDLGPTDEPPQRNRPIRDPARYGDDWSPVLIAWSDPQEDPELGPEAAGLAGPSWMPTGGGEYENVSGDIRLDGDWAAEALGWGGRSDIVHLLMHEIGHLLGLDHVDDIDEVMYHDSDGEWLPEWGPGDRLGLAAIGNGDCDPDV